MIFIARWTKYFMTIYMRKYFSKLHTTIKYKTPASYEKLNNLVFKNTGLEDELNASSSHSIACCVILGKLTKPSMFQFLYL